MALNAETLARALQGPRVEAVDARCGKFAHCGISHIVNMAEEEQSNEELVLQVRALRQELAALKKEQAPSSGGWPMAFRTPWELLFIVVACNIVWAKDINAVVDAALGIERLDHGHPKNAQTMDVAPLYALLPLAMLACWDARYNASKAFLRWIPDAHMNYVLRVAGGYGIVQVLAQDLGIKTGINQRLIVQHPAVQFVMLWGGAFSLTSYRSEGMISVLLYMCLKHNVSNNVLGGVCFEDV